MQNYFYRDKEGREIGPFDLATLTKFRAAGVLDADTPVRTADSVEWKPCRGLIADTSAAPSTPPQGTEPPSGKSGVAQPKWIIGLIILVATIFFVTKKEGVGTGGAPAPSSSLAERSMTLLNEQGHNLRQQNLGLINKLAGKDLRIGMEYQNSNPLIIQDGAGFLFSSMIYIFSNQGVSVYYTVSGTGDIFRRESDGALVTGADFSLRALGGPAVGGYRIGAILTKGDNPTPIVKVIYGPGDRMPVLENALYKVEGSSVYVDWSQAHSMYFALSGANSGSEVWTIKNDGLVLESATSPGYTLTLSMSTTAESANARKQDFGGYASKKDQDEGHNMVVCINNLRLIDSAKQQWALDHRKQTTDTPTVSDILPYLRGFEGNFPKCPSGGVYSVKSVAEPPTCSIPGHRLL